MLEIGPFTGGHGVGGVDLVAWSTWGLWLRRFGGVVRGDSVAMNLFISLLLAQSKKSLSALIGAK